MNISLDKQQYLLEIIPCLCQTSPNTKFIKGAIGITKNEILIYSDMEPNRNNGDVGFYFPFATLPLNSIITLVKSDIKKNHELKKYIRLDIFMKEMNDCRIIYFLKSDKSRLMNFLKLTKKAKVKLVNNVVNYDLGSC